VTGKIAPVLVSRKVLPFRHLRFEQDQARSRSRRSSSGAIPRAHSFLPISWAHQLCCSVIGRARLIATFKTVYGTFIPKVELLLLMWEYDERGMRAEPCKLKASTRNCLSEIDGQVRGMRRCESPLVVCGARITGIRSWSRCRSMSSLGSPGPFFACRFHGRAAGLESPQERDIRSLPERTHDGTGASPCVRSRFLPCCPQSRRQ
jgi:hypothetical protein